MSQSRRLAETLESAHTHTQDARRAAAQHRHRGAAREPLPEQIAGLADLVATLVSIRHITKDLADIAKHCADSVRSDYVHGFAPDGGEWPRAIKDAAVEADTALTKLCQHLNKGISLRASHSALSELHGYVRDAHSNPATK